jgi:hypothetical protein
MKTLILALSLAATLNANEWLYTADRKVAEEFVAALDKACGYPSPATKTWTSVSIQEIVPEKGVTNYAVHVPAVWAPKLANYLTAKTVLPKDRLADVAITDSAIVSAELAKVETKPTAKDELSQKYVLVSKTVVEAPTKVETVEEPKETEK